MLAELQTTHTLRRLSCLGLLILGAGSCRSDTTAPAQLPALPRFSEKASGFTVHPLQLRPQEGRIFRAWGEIVVFVGAVRPPSPCTGEQPANPLLQEDGISACIVIHNLGGETSTGGFIQVFWVEEVVEVEVEFPAEACALYLLDVGAALELPAVQTEPFVTASFFSDHGTELSPTAGSAVRPQPHAGRVVAARPPNPFCS